MKKLVVSCWLLVVGALAANAAEFTINVGEGQTFAYAIDGGELVQTKDVGPAKVTFAANRNATYSFYGVAKNGTATLIESVAITDAGETVSETADAKVAVDTRAEKVIDGSAGAVKVDLIYSGDNWDATVGESATITLALGEREAKTYAEGLKGNGTVEWTPLFDGTYVFQHMAGGEVTETATFNAVGFPGGEGKPWEVGAVDAAAVTAYVKDGYLYLVGKGAVKEFTGDAPWAGLNDMLEGIGPLSKGIVIPASVLATLPITVEGGSEEPFGAIGGAEFEQVRIVGGKAYLAVSVCTNGDLSATTEGWQKAAIEGAQVEKDGTVTLTVPATEKQGFLILKSRAAEK